MKYDINALCSLRWPCDLSSGFAWYVRLLRGACPRTGSRVTFLQNLLRLIPSLEKPEGPFPISVYFKNSCIAFKKTFLYISQASLI
jgi:hypothetical protein